MYSDFAGEHSPACRDVRLNYVDRLLNDAYQCAEIVDRCSESDIFSVQTVMQSHTFLQQRGKSLHDRIQEERAKDRALRRPLAPHIDARGEQNDDLMRGRHLVAVHQLGVLTGAIGFLDLVKLR